MKHKDAVDAAIGAARGLTAADEPLLELARTLAHQMDTGPVGTRTVASYTTVVRALTARLSPLVNNSGSSRLAELRALRDHAKASQTSNRPAS